MVAMNILKQIWQAIWQNKYLALLLVIVAVAAGGWYYFNREVEAPEAPAERVVKVALLSGDLSNLTIKASGRVKSEQEAALSAQIAGVVQGVYTQVGSQVPSGAILLELNNVDQAAATAAAQANVRTAELAVERARHSSFNTGLEAYPVFSGNINTDQDITKPTVSGNYASAEMGEYQIKLYRSHSPTGYSFRYSGLEAGASSALIGAATPLGTRGLYIEFAEGFPFNSYPEWVVPVPNTRSASFSTADGANLNLETALSNLEASQSALDSALSALAKTQIRAPFTGSIVALDVKAGEYVTPGRNLISLINSNRAKQVSVFLNSQNVSRVRVGNQALIEGEFAGTVTTVAEGINNLNGQVEVIIALATPAPNLLIGEFVQVDIQTTVVSPAIAGRLVLPLPAVKAKTTGQVVYVIKDNRAVETPVETGSIIGEMIEIVAGLSGDEQIAAVARGLTDGVKVEPLD